MTKNLRYSSGAYGVNSTYGGYYSWSNAQNVCPSSWILPSPTVYQVLAGKYNYSSIRAQPANFLLGGAPYNCGGGGACSVGAAGLYWTSVSSNAFFVNNNLYISTGENINYSFSVRCISR